MRPESSGPSWSKTYTEGVVMALNQVGKMAGDGWRA